MSAQDAQVIAALRRVLGAAPPVSAGEVTAVEEDARTCTVKLASGLELEGVQLQALAEGKKGVACIPAQGADVLILSLGGGEYFLLCATKYAAIYVDTETEIIINGGTHKGIAKSPALVEKLNAIEDDLNALKNVFKSWAPVSQDGGAALKGAAAGWAGQQVSRTAIEDIENKKLKH